MYQVYVSVYLFISIVSTVPVPHHTSVSSNRHASSDNSTDYRYGSCGFNFTPSDTDNSRKTFNDYISDTTVTVIYLYLKEKSSDRMKLKQYLPEETYRNGLQEWIWLKEEMMYEELSRPIDSDSLTFTITKDGTKEMDIPWSLSASCNLNYEIAYENETKYIVNYLWSSITKNETGSLLCHRSFDDKTLIGTTSIWIVFTVWIGYDYDCFSIDSLMNGDFEITEQSKYDITKLMTVVLGLFAYMHPFIIHLLEIVQPNKTTDLYKYYKNKEQYQKPYGLTRIMQKIFYTPWHDIESRTDKAVKYAPIVRFYFVWTLIVFGHSLYKLLNIKHELFEKEEYVNFPKIYRYGIPEYQFFKYIPWLPVTISIVSYFVCNVWIYILYNENDDFIICLGKDTGCRKCSSSSFCVRSKYILFIPVKDIMETEGNSAQNRWMLNTSKKLIFRFTMLFSLQFWRFIFSYSFCSMDTGGKDSLKKIHKILLFLSHNVFIGTVVFVSNAFINILFCSMPAIWFTFFPLCLKCRNFCCKEQHEETIKTENNGDGDEKTTGSIVSEITSSHSENEDIEQNQAGSSIREHTYNGENDHKQASSNINSSDENIDSKNVQDTERQTSNPESDNQAADSPIETNGDGSEKTSESIVSEIKDTGITSSHSENVDIEQNQAESSKRPQRDNRKKDHKQTSSKTNSSNENIDSEKVQGTERQTSNPESDNQSANSPIDTRGDGSEKTSESIVSEIKDTGITSSHSENVDIEQNQAESSKRPQSDNRKKDHKQASSSVCEWLFLIILFVIYALTVREHANFFVFIERSFAYTIIAGLTVSEHVWRWYLVVLFSFGYFATYILEFLEFYTVLLDTIFEILEKNIDHPRSEEGGDSYECKSNNQDSIDENLFDYIVDNCYTARKRVFLLIIKTVLTTIFMIVSFQILQKTGKFDKMKLLNDTLSIIVILISPKLFLFFSQRKPAEEIEKHVSEIEALYNKYLKRKKERYEGDFLFLCFKECITKCRDNCKCNQSLPFICQLLKSVCDFNCSSSGSDGFFSLTDLRNLKQDNSGDNNNKTANEKNGKLKTAHNIELPEVNKTVEADETESEIRQEEAEPLVKK